MKFTKTLPDAVETATNTLEVFLDDWEDTDSKFYTEAMEAINILKEGLKNEIFSS